MALGMYEFIHICMQPYNPYVRRLPKLVTASTISMVLGLGAPTWGAPSLFHNCSNSSSHV
jgi:hypothetical protein